MERVRIFESEEELSTGLADYVAQLSEAAVKERGNFAIALSGGCLIKLMRKLTKGPYVKTVDWSKWHVFWAEEKVVAKKHPDSNYKQAKEGLLSKVPILPAHVISINRCASAESTAEEYEFRIRQLVRNRTVDVSRSRDCPRFDLILLVLESDGHVASLFPNHPVLAEETQWVTWVSDSSAPYESVTLTLPVINSAANVTIVATGSVKAQPFASATGAHPAQLVSPEHGDLVWFVDGPAASLIGRSDIERSDS
ncbi:putative 6-phosphogluconolactonase 1 [Tasmannia lanceolata]|uniref:putative 6-phosphogluconolactonase 1 n=1 Tax=Tasmannia lanceolata TaxID=3420 RepID=UPI00406401B2